MLRKNPGPHPSIIFLSGGYRWTCWLMLLQSIGRYSLPVDDRNPKAISRRANVSGTAEHLWWSAGLTHLT